MAGYGAGGGPQSVGGGGQNDAFLPTGPTQQVALAATSVTVTLSQFVSTAPYAPQASFYSQGAAATNSVAFVAFGSTSVTVSATNGAVIIPEGLKGQHGGSGGPPSGGYEVLTTGKRPQQYLAIGSVGTTTVWITPGEGRS